jgi:Na+/melibiose symporter-like transporter
MQFVLGYDALEAGIRMTPVAVGILLGAGLSTRLVERAGSKLVVGAGLTIVAGGLAILAMLEVDSSYAFLATAIVVLGFGMGLTMAPATDSVMGAVPAANAGVGSAINDTTRQVGGALGVAILGSVFSTVYGNEMGPATANLPPQAAATASDSVGGALGVAEQLGGETAQALVRAAFDSFIASMEVTFMVAAGVAIGGALLVLLFLPARTRGEAVAAEPGTPETMREVLHA